MKHRLDFSRIRKPSGSFYTTVLTWLMCLSMPAFGHAAEAARPSSNRAVYQEQVTVQGVVQNETDNTPLTGVTIIANGQSISSTDENGRFRVTVAAGTELTFALIGHVSRKVTASASEQNLVVTLSESS